MKEALKISVIVPVYNAETYLRECLDSIVEQTYRNLEVLLINDGSTDGSPEICREYAQKDDRVLFITQENAGEAAARNRGLETASGDYILFVDADDLIAPNICELTVAAIQNGDMLIFDYDQGLEPGSFVQRYIPSVDALVMEDVATVTWLCALLGPEKTVRVQASLNTVWGKLYRRGFLEEHRIRFGSDVVIGEDMLMNLKVILRKPSVRYLPVRGYFYRYNTASLVHRYSSEISRSYRMLHEAISGALEEYGQRENFLEEMGYQKIYGLLQIFSRDIFHPDNPKKEREKKSDFLELVSQKEYQTLIDKNLKLFSPEKRCVLWLAGRKQYSAINVMYQIKRHCSKERWIRRRVF